MTLHSFQYQFRLWLTVILSAVVLVNVTSLPAVGKNVVNTDNDKHVKEVLKRLPDGYSDSIDPEVLIAAIQAAILADPGSIVEIVSALTRAFPLSKGVVIAEAVGRLLAAHPEFIPQTPEIAKAMAIAIAGKTGEPERARALETAYVTSTLVYYLSPNERKNQQLIVNLITEVVSVSPQLEYTREVFGAIASTLRGLGVSEDTIAFIGNKLLDIVNDPTIRNQLRTELWNVYEGPNRFFPGVVVVEETPVTNR